jgi:histone acetyltransferase MYST1
MSSSTTTSSCCNNETAAATQTNNNNEQQQHIIGIPEIGDFCSVWWRDGSQKLDAVIVEVRTTDKNNNKKKKNDGRKKQKVTTTKQQEETTASSSKQQQYYVHYVQHDRRLDEWVSLDKLDLSTLIKKKKKRKNDIMDPDEERDEEEEEEGGAAMAVRRRRRGSFPGSSSSSGLVVASATEATTIEQQQQHSDLTATASNDDNISNPTTATAASSFRLAGGNWHGGSGDPSYAQLEKEHEEITKVKNIEKIYMGGWLVESWYYSPYPADYSEASILYICEYCLKYCKHARTFSHHRSTCDKRRPPGTEIYRRDRVSVYEVDGKEARVYCQNLCLLAKLFLDHKTLYYDTDPFLFYVVCQVDEYGSHLVGYFSKEKVSAEDYNLACILAFPQYQKMGYGKFIISLSYEITKRERKTGSPEKPLSDLGKISYRSYWTHVLMHLLSGSSSSGSSTRPQDLTIQNMSEVTGIKTEDIISTLQSLDMIKCWKGQHVVYVKQDILEDYMKQNKQFRLCDPKYLKWEPKRKANSHGGGGADA